ncbi:MAG: MerR family transcriptional regulator [Ruegeria sp.]
MSKSPDAFRTISEVADWLGVQAHVLRFWESRFTQVKPVKRAGGRRYYRPNDMRLLGGIKKLLHDDGITIKGVQRILREQGVSHVSALSPGLVEPGESGARSDDTVVPFTAKTATEPAKTQIDLELVEKEKETPAEYSRQPDIKPATKAVPSASRPERQVDSPALASKGVIGLAWKKSQFDPQLLRQIAPIAKDLRTWLDRVENRPEG